MKEEPEAQVAGADGVPSPLMLDNIVNSIPDPVAVKDRLHRWVLLNDAYCAFMGYPREQLLGKSDYDFFPRYQADVFWEKDEEVFRSGRANQNEEEFTDAKGVLHVIETKKALYVDPSGAPFIVLVFTDITRRKQFEAEIRRLNTELERRVGERTAMLEQANRELLADIERRRRVEEALRQSEELFSTAFHASPTPIFIGRLPDGIFLDANDRFLAMIGHRRSDILGRSIDSSGIWANPEEAGMVLHTLITERSMRDREVDLRTRNGEVRHTLISAELTQLANQPCALVQLHDITERQRAEDALAAEKERLAVTLSSIADGVIAADINARVILMNREAEQLTGWTMAQAMGRPLPDVLCVTPPGGDDWTPSPLVKLLEAAGPMELTANGVLVSRDGRRVPIEETGAPIRDTTGRNMGVVLVFRDVSERQRLEERLSNAQKLESIGILAGGIAHDFNNLLTGIFGFVELARATAADDSETAAILGDAMAALERAKDLTRQLLTFSKGGAPSKRAISPAALLERSSRFALAGANVNCHLHLPADVWTVEADENQVGQALDNIIINAQQAMPGGGTVDLSAENVSIDAASSLPLAPGPYVKLSVLDHGPGIAREVRDKIFDPFFTTKQQGSGLGLATAYSIVKKHAGYIDVDSEPGQGAIFSIYLPASTSVAAPEHSITPLGVPIRTPTPISIPILTTGGRRARVLVMDDEPAVRQVTRSMLERLGHTVDVASSGAEAIELYLRAREERRPFDITILDLTMPGGMGGRRVLAELLEIDADVRAIAASGYSEDPVFSRAEGSGFDAALKKPFTAAELARIIEKVLALPR